MADIYVTFASKGFLLSALIQRFCVKSFGGRHILFTPEHLDKNLRDYCLANQRGYGFWSWKPHLLKIVLDHLEEEDRLFWIDAGVIPLLGFEKLEFNDIFLQKNIFWDPRIWCKQEIRSDLPEADRFFVEGVIPDASILGIRKTQLSMLLVSRWNDLCRLHCLVSDDQFGDEFSRDRRFVDHRHDQALLGYSAMEIGIEGVDSITQFGTGPLLAYHHRKKINSTFSFASVLCRYFLLLLRVRFGKGQPSVITLSKKFLYRN